MQAQKFREALEKAMLGYTNKQITTAEMIAKLLELAKWVREAKQHGQDLGLSTEEVAFYDALAENGSAKEVMHSDQLRLMARELAEMVKKMPKLDWTQRESVRADLRRKVRRLLAMYGCGLPQLQAQRVEYHEIHEAHERKILKVIHIGAGLQSPV